MMTMANSPFTRPTSVMSMLAEQMQLSNINELHSNISTSAPLHRYSNPDTCFNGLNQHCDMIMNSDCPMMSNESDLSSPQLPSKRLCHSTSNESIARPIAIKVTNKSYYDHIHNSGNNVSRMSSCPRSSLTIKTTQRSVPNPTIRPIISPHYKKSAFTPTRSQASPQTTSSDYSISPDMESPLHRPASVTSSGFHDCSQQSPLTDPNYSPDSNQGSTVTSSGNCKVLPRCHSQPCDEPVSRNFISRSVIGGPNKVCTCHVSSSKYSSQVHTPMKRRYPSLSHIRSNSQSDSTTVHHLDLPIHCHCHRPLINSADASPSACTSQCSGPKRDGYFFGSGRTYLISLPRIASSPPPPPPLVLSQSDLQNSNTTAQIPRQRIGSNSSSLSTSTTTETNTPTVIFNGFLQQKPINDPQTQCYKDSSEDVNMDESFQGNRSTVTFQSYDNYKCIDGDIDDRSCQSDVTATTQSSSSSYSTTGSHCTNESSRSECREPDDPPEIGFCFSQLSSASFGVDHSLSASFCDDQELDLDQIELD